MRYHVVTVSKYIGAYKRTDPTAYAIADHNQANSIVSRKYDDHASAQAEADRLNYATPINWSYDDRSNQ